MALICARCSGVIPDIGGHNCPNNAGYQITTNIPQPRLINGLKCDLCGSTAIDHTEAQCQLNRLSQRLPLASSKLGQSKNAQSKPLKKGSE